jgi:hypothetical protein
MIHEGSIIDFNDDDDDDDDVDDGVVVLLGVLGMNVEIIEWGGAGAAARGFAGDVGAVLVEIVDFGTKKAETEDDVTDDDVDDVDEDEDDATDDKIR